MEKVGTLNQTILKRYRIAPSVERVMREFGRLYELYEEVGYLSHLNPDRSRNRRVERHMQCSLVNVTTGKAQEWGHGVKYEKHTSVMCMKNLLRFQLVERLDELARVAEQVMRDQHVAFGQNRYPVSLADITLRQSKI